MIRVLGFGVFLVLLLLSLRGDLAVSPGSPPGVAPALWETLVPPGPLSAGPGYASRPVSLEPDFYYPAPKSRALRTALGAGSSRKASRVSRSPEVQALELVIKKYARVHGVDENLVWAVIRQESGFNAGAVSPKGAQGLMQLMPGTAALMGVADAFQVEQNIAGGVKYLKRCLDEFNQDVCLALAAYNAGPENVVKYQGCPPFPETRNYVVAVLRDCAGEVRPQGLRLAAKTTHGAKTPDKDAGLQWRVPPPQWRVARPQLKVQVPRWKGNGGLPQPLVVSSSPAPSPHQINN